MQLPIRYGFWEMNAAHQVEAGNEDDPRGNYGAVVSEGSGIHRGRPAGTVQADAEPDDSVSDDLENVAVGEGDNRFHHERQGDKVDDWQSSVAGENKGQGNHDWNQDHPRNDGC